MSAAKKGPSISLIMFFVTFGMIFHQVALAAQPANPYADQISKIASGDLTTADASWWGFHEDDSTQALQQAINSKAKIVIVPYMNGKPWIVGPIMLRSGLDLILQPGVVILAKKGLFKGTSECLFRAVYQNNIQIHGYSATLKMQKADYSSPSYSKGEWRHALSFDSCDNVEIAGLTIQDSGGDGIYLTGTSPGHNYCSNFYIKDVISENNLRQGLSVVSAKNINIVHCQFLRTFGTPPACGIDFEPNKTTDFLVNCNVTDCIFQSNQGSGVAGWFAKLNSSSPEISIHITQCQIEGNTDSGIGIGGVTDQGPKGSVLFTNCQISNSVGPGLIVVDKSANGVLFRFENCSWTNDAAHTSSSPITIKASPGTRLAHMGNIEFSNCTLNDGQNRAAIAIEGPVNGKDFIRGTLHLVNPNPKAETSIVNFAKELRVVN